MCKPLMAWLVCNWIQFFTIETSYWKRRLLPVLISYQYSPVSSSSNLSTLQWRPSLPNFLFSRYLMPFSQNTKNLLTLTSCNLKIMLFSTNLEDAMWYTQRKVELSDSYNLERCYKYSGLFYRPLPEHTHAWVPMYFFCFFSNVGPTPTVRDR